MPVVGRRVVAGRVVVVVGQVVVVDRMTTMWAKWRASSKRKGERSERAQRRLEGCRMMNRLVSFSFLILAVLSLF